MTVGKAIFDLLLDNTDLRAIVNNRIFPEVAQQDAQLPYVVYNISSNEPSDTKREPSKMDTAQVEVNLYSTSYTECIDMSTHVRAALDRVTGTYSGVNVQSIQYLGEVIDFDEAQRAYNITSDYDVRVSRSDFEIAQGSPITGVKLGELSDVDTTGVTDGQVIAYDAAAQEWQPADDAGGVTQLGQLTDVQFGQGGPESGDLLKYDGSEWTNDSLTKSEIGLGNVDNTSDASKPVSTATQTELNAKANSADFSNVDNTSDADKPLSTATQTALNAKADTSAVPTDLNDLSDVSIVGTPVGNQALIYDATAGAFKSQVSYTNRFEDEVESGLYIPTIYAERGYSVKSEGDGTFIDPSPDTPTAGKVIQRKIYHKTGFISDSDVIGDYTLIHTFADDTAYADTLAVFDAFEDGATYGVPPFTLFQTWEEVTAAPSFTGLLNETYGSGAEAAYSTRRLNGNVTECMVIRRASDSTTTTIGFDVSGNIDESAINTFCSGTTCTVQTWKDQSGNGNDATQTDPTKQPTIYTGGAIVKENGRVAVQSDGSNDILQTSDLALSNTELSFFGVATNDFATNQTEGLWGSPGAANVAPSLLRYQNLKHQAVFAPFSAVDFGLADTSQHLLTMIYDTQRKAAQDGSAFATQAGSLASLSVIGLFSRGDTYAWTGNAQEFIFYASDKTTDRTSIESNIGDYFTQNTPLLDTYSGAAAAYSLRRLSSTYTGDAVEVYNGSSYADIGFNVFGELDTVALADHCGSSDGFVSKWYDQSGNTNTAAQTTTSNMPKIYDGSTGVVTENGKPSLNFKAGDFMSDTGWNGASTSYIFNVLKSNGSESSPRIAVDVGSSVEYYGLGINGNSGASSAGIGSLSQFSNGTSIGITRNDIWDALQSQSVLTVSGDFSSWTGGFGLTRSGQKMYTFAQEFIIYNSDQSANRTDIEDNINTFYSIY